MTERKRKDGFEVRPPPRVTVYKLLPLRFRSHASSLQILPSKGWHSSDSHLCLREYPVTERKFLDFHPLLQYQVGRYLPLWMVLISRKCCYSHDSGHGVYLPSSCLNRKVNSQFKFCLVSKLGVSGSSLLDLMLGVELRQHPSDLPLLLEILRWLQIQISCFSIRRYSFSIMI
jgi:hypothetical protein